MKSLFTIGTLLAAIALTACEADHTSKQGVYVPDEERIQTNTTPTNTTPATDSADTSTTTP